MVSARIGRLGMARRGRARLGTVRHGMADMDWRGKARHSEDTAWFGRVWQTWLGSARPGAAGLGRAGQERHDSDTITP